MITLNKTAIIICDYEDGRRGCTETASFTRPMCWYEDNSFNEQAIMFFLESGWVVDGTENLCPYCASGRPNDED